MGDRSTVHIVVNPVAGRIVGGPGSPGGRAVAVLCRRIQQAGLKVSLTETRRRGDALAVAAKCCEQGAHSLVVVGGDGTVNEVVSGLTTGRVPILVVPSGTENILAKYLGIRLDGDLLWRIMVSGRTVGLDIAELVSSAGAGADEASSPSRRPFLLVGGVGFDARIAHDVGRRRQELMHLNGGHISYWTYFGPGLRALWQYHPPLLSVEVDGRRFYRGPAQVLVGNVPRYAMGLRPAYRARPDDGLLDVCIFELRRRVSVLRHLANLLLRRHMKTTGVHYSQGRHIRVFAETGSVPVQVDGDAAGWLPAEFAVTGRQVRFLVPEGFRMETGVTEGDDLRAKR
ncbi:MAG TPA: diacylglycerol kinase family protein [Phycisphaerae bacterium]|nr:diacylglycerol kinase family protein [Phycisphaerae bacterium]